MSVADLEARYGARNYAPFPVVLARGKGVWVWDEAGRRYLDMLGGYSAVAHGHCHPRLVAALTAQAGRLDLVSRAFRNDRLGPFLARACALIGADIALPMNTGAEAVETALKIARKWAYKVKGVAADKAQIIVCDNNFHGRTIAIVGFSSETQYRDGFGPFPAGFRAVPFGDASAFEAAIGPNTAAFLVEPIQGEGGIVVPPPGWLAECARIARANGVLLICDEIQTGLGRTGALLAADHDAVKPDLVLLGKALGGGLVPVSLVLGRRDVMAVLAPGDHGSTFGGYPIAAAVGLEALETLLDEDLIQRSAALGERLMAQLSALNGPLIAEIRGRGLFVGVVLTEPLAHELCLELITHGILAKDTRANVVRLAPPLVISRDEVDWAVTRLHVALANLARTHTAISVAYA